MTPSQRDAADSVRWRWGVTLSECADEYYMRYVQYDDGCATVDWVAMGNDEGGPKR